MTLAQGIYLGLVLIYTILFGLFLRLFVWRHYAYRNSWSRRPKSLSLDLVDSMAQERGRERPKISIFVPARNESDVIERTIDHMAGLDYPTSSYEIIVATDEKEKIAADEDKADVAATLTEFLAGEADAPAAGSHADVTLTALLSRLALTEGAVARRHSSNLISLRAARTLPQHRQERALMDLTAELLRSRGWVSAGRLQRIFEQAVGFIPEEESRRLFPVFLSLAMPVMMARHKLVHDEDERMVTRMLTKAARASQPLTQKILQAMTDALSARILDRLTRMKKQGVLDAALAEAYTARFPTTLDIVDRKVHEWSQIEGRPALKHAVVPYDFDGNLGGVCTGKPVPSTKGRALNFATRLADPKSEMFGFYDAESRPDGRVLQYVAYRVLQGDAGARILQGPVFQVRNFYDMRPINKVAALYQAISHDWILPNVFKRLPFVGGTNLYIAKDLLYHIGGYDDTCLTEDVELGIRAYLETGAWPEYLPYPSSEQTPETFLAFYRQRLRWGSGYLQVFDKVRAATQYDEEMRKPLLRTLYMKGHVEWSIFQATAFLPILVWILWWRGLVDPTILIYPLRVAFGMVSVVYFGFTMYAFVHYSPHVDPARPPYPMMRQALAVFQLLLLPFSAFFLPVPYSSALVLKAIGRAPKQWVKTPRTQE